MSGHTTVGQEMQAEAQLNTRRTTKQKSLAPAEACLIRPTAHLACDPSNASLDRQTPVKRARRLFRGKPLSIVRRPLAEMPMDWSIPQLLYEENFGIFLLVTLAMGGGAAWASGRAIAATWRPWWQIVAYMLILAAAVRFIHFALFDGTLLSLHYYTVDAAVCLLFGFLGFRVTRAGQMATQYGFLNVRTGLVSWARRPAASEPDGAKSG